MLANWTEVSLLLYKIPISFNAFFPNYFSCTDSSKPILTCIFWMLLNFFGNRKCAFSYPFAFNVHLISTKILIFIEQKLLQTSSLHLLVIAASENQGGKHLFSLFLFIRLLQIPVTFNSSFLDHSSFPRNRQLLSQH